MTWLLDMMGAKTYSLVRILVVPAELKSKSMEELTQVLKQHFEHKHLVIARRFYFTAEMELPKKMSWIVWQSCKR